MIVVRIAPGLPIDLSEDFPTRSDEVRVRLLFVPLLSGDCDPNQLLRHWEPVRSLKYRAHHLAKVFARQFLGRVTHPEISIDGNLWVLERQLDAPGAISVETHLRLENWEPFG